MTTFPPVQRLGRVIAAFALALSLGACKELTQIDASYANVTFADTVFTLNQSPPNAPNALKLFEIVTNRADQSFGYDIAFDIDAGGNVVLIPARAIASSFAGPYSVGLQKMTGTFESVLEAPKDGYRADTAMVVGIDQPVVIESRDDLMCRFSLKGQSYFSKIVITAVDPDKRTIGFTATINRNCGFRSFAAGIPRD
jgi:hypothetical protein